MATRSTALTAFLLFAPLACGPGGDGDSTETETETGSGGIPGAADPLVDRCNPSLPLEQTACAEFIEPHLCCSDDPAALDLGDLTAYVTPAYQGRGGEGTPLFSATNNPLSQSGVCVIDAVPQSSALSEVNAQGCPVPCNPQWAASDIEAVCGSNQLCCQFQELEPEDCGFDPNLGDAGCFRPVTGDDIQGFGGLDASDWSSSAHATHQDPGGLGCLSWVMAVPADVLADNGLDSSEVLLACYRRLTVANQRGLCLGSSGGIACPYAQPDYIDACEQLNNETGLSGC